MEMLLKVAVPLKEVPKAFAMALIGVKQISQTVALKLQMKKIVVKNDCSFHFNLR
jgi:hypothetical protein